MKQKKHLHTQSLRDARQRWFTAFADPGIRAEEVAVIDACGRVTAEPVYARRSAPHFAVAAMAGILAMDTLAAGEAHPICLAEKINAFSLDTGDPIPTDCNAVIRMEEVDRTGDGKLRIAQPASPWQHVRNIGESVARGEMVLTADHTIRSYDIGGLLEAGITRLRVWARPRVGIIPTGTELVPAERTPGCNQLVEFNSHILKAAVAGWGGIAQSTAILPDRYEEIKEQILTQAAENEILVVLSGSSVGEGDLTAAILRELGEVLVHGESCRSEISVGDLMWETGLLYTC